jgi:hypothetical protein
MMINRRDRVESSSAHASSILRTDEILRGSEYDELIAIVIRAYTRLPT